MSALLAGVLIFSSAFADDGYQPPIWSSSPDVLACPPKTLQRSDDLRLELGPGHGRELAIRRVSDDAWFFLVISSPAEDEPQLMTPEAFASKERIEVPLSFKARASADGALEPVIGKPGAYEVYVSDNLESEDGGFLCTFRYVGD